MESSRNTRLSLDQVSHICQQGNRPAQILARCASHIVGHVTWIEEISYMIEFVVVQDVLFYFLNKVTVFL